MHQKKKKKALQFVKYDSMKMQYFRESEIHQIIYKEPLFFNI